MSSSAVIRRAWCDKFLMPSQGRSAGAGFTILFQMEGTAGTQTVRAAGEGILYVDQFSDAVPEAWRSVCDAVDRLRGAVLSSSREQVDAGLRAILDDLRSDDTGIDPGLLAGLDMCLSDFAARATGNSLARVLGVDHTERTPNVTVIDMRRQGDRLSASSETPHSAEPGGVVRLTGIPDHTAAIDAAATATEVLGTKTALWLQLRGRLTDTRAYRLVGALADRIRRGHISDHVVLYEPVADIETLAALQSFADSELGDNVLPGLVIMAHPRTVDRARTATGRVRALELNPQELGGAHRLFDLANEIHAAHNDQLIALSAPPAGLGVAASALPDLAAALPRCDYLGAPERSRRGDETFAHVAADELTISLARAAGAIAGRHAPRDKGESGPDSAENRSSNDFSDEPIMPLLDAGARAGSHLLEYAGLKAGLTVTRFARDVITLDHADLIRPLGFAMGGTPWSGVPARRLVQDAVLTRRLLQQAGIPTGARGMEHGHGRGHREFLVVAGLVVSVLACESASVTGDGRSTVVDLVLDENVARRRNPSAHSRPLGFSPDTVRLLGDQQLSIDSVPEAGRRVVLATADGNTGDTTQLIDDADVAEGELAVRAAQLIAGLEVCSVVVVNLAGGHPVVEAIDAAPDISRHHFPTYGKPVDVADHLVRRGCELAGFTPSAPASRSQARIEVSGHLQGGDAPSWLTAYSEQTGLHVVAGEKSGATVLGDVASLATVSTAVLVSPFGRGVEKVTSKPGDDGGQRTTRRDVL